MVCSFHSSNPEMVLISSRTSFWCSNLVHQLDSSSLHNILRFALIQYPELHESQMYATLLQSIQRSPPVEPPPGWPKVCYIYYFETSN